MRLPAAALIILMPVMAAVPATAAADEPDDFEIDKAEPDFTIITLPTTLRLPRHIGFNISRKFH